MAKQQTFADKLKKGATAATCPECGEVRQPTMVLQPTPTDSGTFRMREIRTQVCKCNRKDIYG